MPSAPNEPAVDQRIGELRAIIDHAYRKTSFYRSQYDAAGVGPEHFHDLADLEKFPTVTATDLVAAGTSFRASDERPYRVSCSSGTVRNPKILYRTHEDTKIGADVLIRLLTMAGLGRSDSLLIGQPFDLAHLGYLTLDACRQMSVLAIPVGISVTDDDMAKLVDRFEPTAIFTSPSRISRLAAMGATHGLRTVLLAGERTTQEHRNVVTNVIGALPYDLYGSEDTDGLAGSCQVGEGLHFMADLFHLELLPLPQHDDPCVGEAVVTSLYSRGTPLVRYRLGDVVRRLDRPCLCGRPWPLIEVLGRADESFDLYDGITLHGWQLASAVDEAIPGHSGFQAVRRRDQNGHDVISVTVRYLKQEALDSRLEAVLLDRLWHSSLDLAAARAIGSLLFETRIIRDDLSMNKRGKTPRLIDQTKIRG